MSKKILAVAAMLMMSLAFTACGDDPVTNGNESGVNGGDNGGDNGGGGDINTPSGNVDPTTEKEYIDAVGKEFVSLFNASDYQDVTNMSQELEDIDGEGIFADFIKETQTGTYEWTQLLVLANVKGSFSAKYGNKKWTQTSKDGNLTMKYTDRDGKVWTLREEHSGSWGAVTVDEEDDYCDAGYINESYQYNVETTIIKIEVPKNIKVTLTKGNETVANVDLNITNLNINGGEPTLNSKASYNLTAQIKDLQVSNNAEYNPGGAAMVKAEIKKNGRTIVTVDLAGNTTMSKDEITDGNVTSLNVCILNALNVKGSIKNINKLVEAIEEADNNCDKESAFDRWLKNANSYIDLGLYNNNPTKQATITLGKDSHQKYDYYSGGSTTYYEIVPMINFSDGTSYSFEDYFTEKNFRSLMDQVEKLIKDFERLVD